MGLTVVLVEDDDFVARAVMRALSRDAHVVHRVATEEGAMALVGCFDVAVVDLNLSRGSGVSTAIRLRRAGAVRRVIFFTGDVHGPAASAALRIGPVLSKDVRELRQLLDSWS
jgi:ActR/RegA family two-component response regulator